MLILDEPTNHLDIEAREALVQAINEFAGAVVLVSHDWHLLELVADRLWLVADGTVRPFDGDLDDYRRLVLEPPEPVGGNRRAETDQRRAARRSNARTAQDARPVAAARPRSRADNRPSDRRARGARPGIVRAAAAGRRRDRRRLKAPG